jgi:hypothetical protein
MVIMKQAELLLLDRLTCHSLVRGKELPVKNVALKKYYYWRGRSIFTKTSWTLQLLIDEEVSIKAAYAVVTAGYLFNNKNG